MIYKDIGVVMINTNNTPPKSRIAGCLALSLAFCVSLAPMTIAQTEGDATCTLDPFLVSAAQGYTATSTISGTGLNTPLINVPMSINVITSDFLDDSTIGDFEQAMDDQIGRLRLALSELGVADNTMLWFCSDNGPARQGSPRHVGSPGHLSGYKLSIQEGGIRVPGLLVWPDQIKQPITVSDPCVTSDYFPTILSSLEMDLPVDRIYDGINLWPLIQGQSRERTKPIGFLNREATEAVWVGARYKLISTPEGDQLFDIIKDPAEKADLSAGLPSITRTMKYELNQWKAGVLAELNSIQ